MFAINENERLFKLQRYSLHRGSTRVFIDVGEIVAGTRGPSQFYAIPNIILEGAREEFIGTGDTELEALNDCLKRLKDVSFDELFDMSC